jgi:hypothetical protein
MSDDKIAELINELKRVHLHEQRIIDALEQAYRTSDRASTVPANINIDTVNTPTTASATPPPTANIIPPFIPKFCTGDCVIITNKVRRPNDRPIDINDRRAVVLQVISHDRVNIRTYNGTVTWRAPKNLKHQDE